MKKQISELQNKLMSLYSNPKTAKKNKNQEEIERLSTLIINLQSEISVKRGEIIDFQNDLLIAIEPILFNTLSESKSLWDSTMITQIWISKMTKINNIILDHEELVKKFESQYYQLEKITK